MRSLSILQSIRAEPSSATGINRGSDAEELETEAADRRCSPNSIALSTRLSNRMILIDPWDSICTASDTALLDNSDTPHTAKRTLKIGIPLSSISNSKSIISILFLFNPLLPR